MSDPEKPLHVKVAEALGWTLCADGFMYHPPDTACEGTVKCSETATGRDIMPRYDTDWSATGPLIEKYGIVVWRHTDNRRGWGAGWDEYGVEGHDGLQFDTEASGPTPLIAVCRLILSLKEAGKL